MLGLSVAELSISTCNERWAVEFQRRGDTVYKLGSLQGVSLYLDSAQLQLAASVLSLLDADAAAASSQRGHGTSGVQAARAAAVRRSRALSTFGHIFEAQRALGQISIASWGDAVPDRSSSSTAGSAASRSAGRTETGTFSTVEPGSRRADARAYADAYCYVLKPVSIAVRATMPVGSPLDKAKIDATVAVDAIALAIADRQYALLMHVFSEHNDAWEARKLGLAYRSIMFFDPSADDDVDAAPDGEATRTSDSDATDSDADSDADDADFRAIGRATVKVPRTTPAQRPAADTPAISKPRVVVKFRRKWLRLLHALCMRRRAALREAERHRYLAEVAVEYIQLYLRRLKVTEIQGLAALTPAERRCVRLSGDPASQASQSRPPMELGRAGWK